MRVLVAEDHATLARRIARLRDNDAVAQIKSVNRNRDMPMPVAPPAQPRFPAPPKRCAARRS
jgi:hypothetical protein